MLRTKSTSTCDTHTTTHYMSTTTLYYFLE